MTQIVDNAALHAAAVYAALFIIGAIVLTVGVVRERRRCGIGIGGGDPKLDRAIRVHANYVENVPLGMAALILLPLIGASSWLVHAIGLMMIVGRIAHVQGLSSKQGASPGRAIGMVMTWLSLLMGALALLWKALA